MRISIISSSFFESTFPLAKHLSKDVSIDLFCVVQQTHLNPPMLDLSAYRKELKCGVYSEIESRKLLPGYVNHYFSSPNISLRLVVFSGGKKIIKDLFTVRSVIRELHKHPFSVYHFIGTYVLFPLIERKLNPKKIIHTLHEDLDRLNLLEKNRIKKYFLRFQFNLLRKKNIRLIFHSENVRKMHHENHLTPEATSICIPFGLFESYNYFPGNAVFEFLNRKYYLFVGYIHPYKGVDTLLAAAELISAHDSDMLIVIAGKDSTNIKSRIKLSPDVVFIDRYLSEEEIVTLVKNCFAVVMPYLNASQSGIPNTCFCFGKPIISSNLEGLNQIIIHDINGLHFQSGNKYDLEKVLVSLWNDTQLYDRLVENIKTGKNMGWLNWDEIAEKTLSWYKQLNGLLK